MSNQTLVKPDTCIVLRQGDGFETILKVGQTYLEVKNNREHSDGNTSFPKSTSKLFVLIQLKTSWSNFIYTTLESQQKLSPWRFTLKAGLTQTEQ